MTTSKIGVLLRTVGFTLTIGVLVVLGVFVVRPWIYDAQAGDGEEHSVSESKEPGDEDSSACVPVQVILPKLDPTLTVCVTQPAYVTPYYQIDLRARVAGPVLS